MDGTTSRDEQFQAFVMARRPALVRLATLLAAGDQHLAEDLVQSALTRLYVAWPRVARDQGPEAYARRILVNTVCPGGMRTGMLLNETSPELVAKAEREMIPLRRLAEPVEVARIIAWLVSDQNTYATGAEFDITGGIALH